ncbi:hypothetical protein LTR15_006497 [Elasticomyces elasticus]|nr:hypothetical protein LTR15_006497 [Elasticomyces elasticus]
MATMTGGNKGRDGKGGGGGDKNWRSDAKTRADDAISLSGSSDSSMPTTPKKIGNPAPSSGKSKEKSQKTETQNPGAAGNQMTPRPRQIVAVGKVRVMHDDGTFGDLLVCARLHKANPGSKYGEKIKYFYDSHPVSMTEKLSSLMADDDTSNKPRGAPPTFVWLDKYAIASREVNWETDRADVYKSENIGRCTDELPVLIETKST